MEEDDGESGAENIHSSGWPIMGEVGAGGAGGESGGSESLSPGDLLRKSIAANESELVAYTHEHDTGSKDRPGREFSQVRGTSTSSGARAQERRHR